MSSDVLSNICEMRRENCAPHECKSGVYVGLEHIDSGRFVLSRHGSPGEVRSAKNRFYPRDVLYGKLRPYLDKAVVAETEGICSTDILVLEPLEVPSWFLCGVLHTDPFIEHAKQTTHGVNHPRTSWSGIKVFKGLSLPLPEQKKIAAVLLKIQRAIETQEKIIQSVRDLKKSTMQHLFTHGLRDEKTKMTEIDEIPESWEMVQISEISKERPQNGIFIKDPIWGNGFRYLNVADVYKRLVVDAERLQAVRCSYEAGKSFLLETGDILFVRSSLKKEGIGMCCVYMENKADTLFDCHLIRVRLKQSRMNPIYFASYWASAAGQNELIRRSKTTTMTTINQKSLAEALIPIPVKEEQEKIAKIYKNMQAKVDIHESKKSSLQVLFKTALNKLMTGEIRVGDFDIDVSEVEG